MQPVTVRAIHIYPIKSAGGVAVEQAAVTDRGFAHDRRFMVVDDAGEFITQRQHPAMALLSTRIEADTLVLTAPRAGTVAIPLTPAAGERRAVRLWGDTVQALSVGPEAATLLQRYLDTKCELVYMPDEAIRLVDPDGAGDGDRVSLADGYPFLLISEASLEDLNARLARPVPMDRFRPNLVVGGAAAYAEDGWDELVLGDVTFRAVKPCGRCAVVTVDQRTGFQGKEPLATLATYRNQGGEVLFGQNLVHRGRGVVRVGDRVRPPR